MSDPIRITAEEINCLIYSYFRDSGFTHSAFTLCNESQLDRSPHFTKHIPRGELVELLGKALLYLEVESHWKNDHLATNCKAGFSLLDHHVCSLEATPNGKHNTYDGNNNPIPYKMSDQLLKMNGADPKRKASTPSTDDVGPPEKRTRRDQEELGRKETEDMMDVDPEPNAKETPVPPTTESTNKKGKVRRPPGPEDNNAASAIYLLPGHKTEVFVCAWNPVQLDLLASGSKDAVVNIWNVPGPAELGGIPPPPTDPPTTLDFMTSEQADLTSLHWNSEGTLLALGSYDSILRICTASGSLYFSHPQHLGPIFATRFCPSGKWLLTASLDGTACVWNVQDKVLYMQYKNHDDCCLDVDWLDNNTFASCGADARIHICKIGQHDPIKTLVGHANEINQIKCNPSSTRLASCSDDMTARIWNISNLSNGVEDSIPGLVASDQSVVLEGHRHSVSSVGWCPDYPAGSHEILATASFDGSTRLWDSVTGECLKVFQDHRRSVYALSFSPEGQWLATGSGDGYLHIYSMKDRERRWSYYAGSDKPGVFEIDWQRSEKTDRLALALENRQVGVIDISRVPLLQNP